VNHWLVWVLFVAALAGGLHWFFNDREIHHPSGAALAPSPPAIVLGSDGPSWVDEHGFQYRALGRMSGRVVVVSRTNYAIGEFAHLAPTDLAIAWGQLSDPGTYRQIHFDQRGSPLAGRFVIPEVKRGTRLAVLPFPEVEAFLLLNLAHVHAIPADKEIAAQLAHIRPGQVVTFSGFLVEAKSPTGGMYLSSLKLGTYHCEIAWVDELTLE
jgi:hypothetical protein